MPVFERVAFAPNYLGYLEGFELQKKVHAEVVAGKRKDTVLLLEHQSVYTAGKRTELNELPDDGSEFVETNRGGKITWHGPGQLVGYPIMHLPKPIDVVGYVRFLEQVIIDAISEFDVRGIRFPVAREFGLRLRQELKRLPPLVFEWLKRSPCTDSLSIAVILSNPSSTLLPVVSQMPRPQHSVS